MAEDSKSVWQVMIKAFGKLPSDTAHRRFVAIALIDATGTGMFLPVTVLFFTRIAGLSPLEVATGLSAGGMVGLAAAPVGGFLLDRVDARWVLQPTLAVRAFCYAAYGIVHSVVTFIPLACLANAAAQVGRPARNMLVTQIAADADRVRLLAFASTARNVGFGVGGLLASVALAADSKMGYFVVLGVNAASYVAAAALLPGMPPRRNSSAGHAQARKRLAVLRDRTYVLLAALNSLLLVHDSVLVVGVPLWLAEETAAPRMLAGFLFTLNTILVVTLQIRASQSGATVTGAARAYRYSGLAFLVSCAIFASSMRLGAVLASVVLVLGVTALTGSEIWGAVGEWGVSLGLAPDELRGQYLSLYSMGFGLQKVFGPAVVALVVTDGGRTGWFLLGTVVLVTAFSASVIAKRASPRHATAALPV